MGDAGGSARRLGDQCGGGWVFGEWVPVQQQDGREEEEEKEEEEAAQNFLFYLLPAQSGEPGYHVRARGGRGQGRGEDRVDNHFSDTCTLHAEPLNSVHCMKGMGFMEAMNKLIEEKVIAGDTGEEFVLKNGMPADSLYGDRAHMYIPWGCWLDWVKNRRQYVRRVGYAPEWTDLLLTYADGQVCWEEWVEQTLSAKTVKNLIWLLSQVPPHSEFQLGRAHAV